MISLSMERLERRSRAAETPNSRGGSGLRIGLDARRARPRKWARARRRKAMPAALPNKSIHQFGSGLTRVFLISKKFAPTAGARSRRRRANIRERAQAAQATRLAAPIRWRRNAPAIVARTMEKKLCLTRSDNPRRRFSTSTNAIFAQKRESAIREFGADPPKTARQNRAVRVQVWISGCR